MDLRREHGFRAELRELLSHWMWCKGAPRIWHLYIQLIFIEHPSCAKQCCSRYCGYSSEQGIKSLTSWNWYLSQALRWQGGVPCLRRGNTWGEAALIGRAGKLNTGECQSTGCPSRWRCWWGSMKFSLKLRREVGGMWNSHIDVEIEAMGTFTVPARESVEWKVKSWRALVLNSRSGEGVRESKEVVQ